MAPQTPRTLFDMGRRFHAGCSHPAWNDGGGGEDSTRGKALWME
jgi:hypothetical protein